MNKQDLVAEVAVRTDVSRRVATEALDAVIDSIMRAVARGEKVSLPGFGSFEKRLRAPRTARNPQTGAKVRVPAMSVPAFRPGSGFKAQVAGRTKGPAKTSGAKIRKR